MLPNNRCILKFFENWTCQVCKFIDGVNHVSRIAHLADCDPELTRQAISHLLYVVPMPPNTSLLIASYYRYYQVIMMIDIFQYSNMYTLRKGIQWLADEPHVREECASYVTKSGECINVFCPHIFLIICYR